MKKNPRIKEITRLFVTENLKILGYIQLVGMLFILASLIAFTIETSLAIILLKIGVLLVLIIGIIYKLLFNFSYKRFEKIDKEKTERSSKLKKSSFSQRLEDAMEKRNKREEL